MRQAVEQSFEENLGAVEEIAGVLLQHSTDEEQLLARISSVLVETLEYAGVLIVIAADDRTLFLRAFSLEAPAGPSTQLESILQAAVEGEKPMARLDKTHEQSLAVRAVRQCLAAGSSTNTKERQLAVALTSASVFELLYPLLKQDEAAEWQAAAQVQSVLALPFLLPEELCGSLLIMSQRPTFADHELRLLHAVAQHVALGLRNARLYWRMEEQRRVAQTFAHMAFSGSAYLHTLRNRIGALRTYLGLVQMLPRMKPQQRASVIRSSSKAMESLDQAAEILDHLHEPWRRQSDEETDVNDCLTAALLKVFRGSAPNGEREEFVTPDGMRIAWRLTPDLPAIQTSQEMLTEAFRIIIRNAADSLQEKYGEGQLRGRHLTVESELLDRERIAVTIRDDGTGIAPGDLQRIFELGWSTKKGAGMGFGLFWTRNFVEGLGGKIEVESAPQEGATFRLVLPIAGSSSW